MTTFNQIRTERLNALRESGAHTLYRTAHVEHVSCAQLASDWGVLAAGESSTRVVVVSGRIRSIRNSGKFIDIYDDTGKVQLLNSIATGDTVGEAVKLLDVGDVVDAIGTIMKTRTGELTIRTTCINVLAKCLHPIPDQKDGFTDQDARMRQRYLDMIVNPHVVERMKTRSAFIRHLRDRLHQQNYMEVETPMLHDIPSGAVAEPFVTLHTSLDADLYLRIAPELHLKRLMVGGLPRIFELNRCFRNEGLSPRHNPEFTSLEAYCAHSTADDMMRLLEFLVESFIGHDTDRKVGAQYIDFIAPWRRCSMLMLLHEHTGIDFYGADDVHAAARRCNTVVDDRASWGEVIETVFDTQVAWKLIKPTHVTGIPLDISPLAASSTKDPRVADRFETYINGMEVANGFTELTDPAEQLERLTKQGREVDVDFIRALEYGMPPAAGIGIGIDRLVMLLTDASSIREVIAFPTLRKR